MVAGALQPTAGSVTLGCRRIGYCPQSDSIDPYVTVEEQLRVAALLAGYSRAQSREVAAGAMDTLGLQQYSKVGVDGAQWCTDIDAGPVWGSERG
jgi:ABC-type multidrug transport system ATPase subunit